MFCSFSDLHKHVSMTTNCKNKFNRKGENVSPEMRIFCVNTLSDAFHNLATFGFGFQVVILWLRSEQHPRTSWNRDG